jgi:choline dehydrogenase-like flavoprotein
MTTNFSRFDFVIVGGGTAGLALAVRLSEDAKISVCVVEADQNLSHTPEMSIPGGSFARRNCFIHRSIYIGMTFQNIAQQDRVWPFTTTPQPSINSRSIPLPRGKTLGGTSAVCISALFHPSSDST